MLLGRLATAPYMTPTVLFLTPIIKQAGIVLNVASGVSRISVGDIFKNVRLFMIAQLIVLLLTILFPSLVIFPAEWFAG